MCRLFRFSNGLAQTISAIVALLPKLLQLSLHLQQLLQ